MNVRFHVRKLLDQAIDTPRCDQSRPIATRADVPRQPDVQVAASDRRPNEQLGKVPSAEEVASAWPRGSDWGALLMPIEIQKMLTSSQHSNEEQTLK